MSSPIDRLLDELTWKELATDPGAPADIPQATHVGVLKIGDLQLRVYQLSSGEQVINAEDLESLIGFCPIEEQEG